MILKTKSFYQKVKYNSFYIVICRTNYIVFQNAFIAFAMLSYVFFIALWYTKPTTK